MTDHLDDEFFLDYILDEMRLLEGNLCTSETFIRERYKAYALLKIVENIGEACKKLTPQFKEEHKDIPWRAMSYRRDFIAHGMFGINYNRAYKDVIKTLKEFDSFKKLKLSLAKSTKTKLSSFDREV